MTKVKDPLKIFGEEKVTWLLEQALAIARTVTASRTNSLTQTKIEEALMWNNKDRTLKGQLKPYSTHV